MNWYKISLILLLFLTISCKKNQDNNTDIKTAVDTTVAETAKEAYLYGLPMVLMDITRRQMTHPDAGKNYKPVNQFRHNSDFPDANFKNVVRPNADTYYSIAWLDLSAEPIILSLPDTHGRYYMMPIMDAYSNVFSSPGTRTTGNKAINLFINGPDWKGKIPDNSKQISSPTNTVWIIGRTQVNSKEDGIKNVIPLQQQYKIISLSVWEKKSNVITPKASSFEMPKGDPNQLVKSMPVEEYFNLVNDLLAKNSPPENEKKTLEKFASLGIGAGKRFDLKVFSPQVKTAIHEIPNQVFETFSKEKSITNKLINGWNLGRKIIGSYGTDYYSRASTAYFGLGANLREDAIYPSCFFDNEGKKLNGANKYVLHFEKGKTPPANAFWSLTMYDPEGYFISNNINRYTLGDRSNLKTNADGSVDIYIQKNTPEKSKETNWLPSPKGDFNLLLRVYWPKQEILNGNWTPPSVKKL
ncbi:hypothetical protein EV144_10936 [Flavobacterium sp. 270]|uniref:DUF1254 domain-containing protein n=1 Tax=Flavobacterium sp. 270 TaxID=2512114 RepID=UPI001064F414|nr:DUF1254 domain-containing protein [Flavobacterium sp. 270]TDW44287.1 hypothetical protein EV144_10936 [Flavobacterium sp. 270]